MSARGGKGGASKGGSHNGGKGLDWQAIKDQYPIADIIGQAITLKKRGNEYQGLCPFHAEKTPSFQVVPDKDFYHCQGCGAHGDVVDFIANFKGITIGEAIDTLTGGASIDQSPEDKAARERALAKRREDDEREAAKAIAKARKGWQSSLPADPHHPYLVRKQVPAHTLRQTPDGMLVLPIYGDDGEVQSVQIIDDNGKKLFIKNAPTGMGRMYIGINMGRTILCEGYATGATIYDAIPEQVCVTFSLGNMEKVARAMVADGRSIVLAADTGLATKKMLALGEELAVPVVVPPTGMELVSADGEISDGTDFNDMAICLGIDAVAARFSTSMRAFADHAALERKATSVESGPVDLWAKPAGPVLQKGWLPAIIDRHAFEKSAQMGTDPGGLAMADLAACASVISDRIQVKVKVHETWAESARLWVMIVGDPSAKKSPIMRAASGKIKSIDADLLRDANTALLEWQDAGGTKSDQPKPASPRLRIEDVTMEAAQEVCKDSPDGILAIQDELTGWFGGIEKYGAGKGAGKDRSFWLQSYGGGSYAVNRVGRGSFLIENLSISIIGGIQPDVVQRVMTESTDDGLIQRFLPVMLGPATPDMDIEIPPVQDEYNDMIERLHNLKTPSNFFGDCQLQFDEDAQAVRAELTAKHHADVIRFEAFNKKLSSHIGKYDGLFPRLCVVFHCVEHVTGPNKDEPLSLHISGCTARRVADFMADYIMRHAYAFYLGAGGLTEGYAEIVDVAEYILAHKLETVTVRTLTRNVRSIRKISRSEDVTALMDRLEDFGWLDRVQKRADAPSWTVNPDVHAIFAAKAVSEAERRKEIRLRIQEVTSAGTPE